MQILSPGTRIGQYEIASRPMMGGMGVVYFALDHGNDGRPVALKTFRPELLPDRAARDRFLREGTAWVELGNHPHIVRCYKVEYIDPTAFLVLELIAKEQNMPDASLRSWLIPGRPLPLDQALLFALQIARGMQYATEKISGFVHRDLKPENILVGADQLLGTNINRLRVTDFGLAKKIANVDGTTIKDQAEDVKQNHIQFTREVGTPLYMAPEQWNGKAVGVYTDVYAFGCILYEMLSGRHAAYGKTIAELRVSHCDGKLQLMPSQLPNDIRDLLGKCLATHQSKRYENWRDLTDLIEYAYSKQSSVPFPSAAGAAELRRDLRLQEGWSYNVIGLAYMDIGNVKVSVSYFEKALAIAREFNDRSGAGHSIGNLGNAYRIIGNPRKAIDYHEQCLVLHREIGDRLGEAKTLGNLGITHMSIGNLQQAIIYFEQQLAIAREIGNRYCEGNALGNLGNSYALLNETKRAIEYYQLCLDLHREIGNRRGEGNALGSLGLLYSNLGNALQGIKYFEHSLEIHMEIGDRLGEGIDLDNLGNAYADLGNIQRAIFYYEQKMEIAREINDLSGLAAVSFNMALLFAQQGEPVRALPLAQSAARIWNQIESPASQRAQQLIAQLNGDAP